MKNFLNLDNLQRFAVTYNHTNYKLNKTITTKDADGRILSNWINNTIPTLKDIRITDMSGTITNCYSLFRHAQNLISIDLTNFNTNNVTNMSNMFFYCSNLTGNISNFNTSNVTNMSKMFFYCSNLTGIPNFNTGNVINMSNMFYSCSNLTGIPNFNTSKVTDMHRMFYGCRNLTGNISNFNTSNVTNMSNMFGFCYNLIGGNFNFTTVSKVTNMSNMFYECNNLNQNALNSIYNMCINATSVSQKNLSNSSSYSPLYGTKFNNSYIPSSFKTRLTAAGWTY